MASSPAAPLGPIRGALRIIAYAKLWLIIVCGFITFAFFLWTTPTRWFNYRSDEFVTWRNTLVLQYNFVNATTGKQTPLLSNSISFVLIWQWCGTLAVALAAGGLHWLSHGNGNCSLMVLAQTAPALESARRPKQLRLSLVARARRASRRLHHLLHMRLPPRGLWRALLGPGGLSVLDLLLVLMWAALHAMWMYEMTGRALEVRRMAPPPFRVLARSSPDIKSPAAAATNTTTSIASRAMPSAASAVNVTRRLLQINTTATKMNTTSAATSLPAPATAKPAKPLPRAVQGSVAKYFGWVAQMDILLLFYPLPRCNFLHWILGSDFATMIKYHRWLGHGTLLACSLHGIMYLALWTHDGTLSTYLTFGMSGTNMVAGLVSLAAGWLLWLTSIPAIRRWLYSLFYITHLLAGTVFLLFTLMHYKDSAAWMMAGIFLYLLDVALRTVQQALNWTRLSLAADTASGAAASISPDGSLLTLSLKCDESLEWHGSDIVCLNVPAVSWWQWHPFTLASSSKITFAGGEKRMVLHIKKYNRWTKQLFNRLASDATPVKLYVSGPYGSANRKWLKGFDRQVFIAGGVGATPALGMLLELIALRRASSGASAGAGNGSSCCGRVSFIWVSRSEDELNTLPQEILQEAGRGEESWLDIHLYLTHAPAPEPPAASHEVTSTDGIALQIGSLTNSGVAAAVALSMRPPAAAAASGSATSRPLVHPYMLHPLLWMAALLLCFGGGFAGLMCADAYDARIIRTVAARSDYSYVGMLQFAALGAGAFLPPALLMLAAHLYWRFVGSRRPPSLPKLQDDSFTLGAPSGAPSILLRSPWDVTRLGSITAASQCARSSVVSIDVGSISEFAFDTPPKDVVKCRAAGSVCGNSVCGFTTSRLEPFLQRGRPDLPSLLAAVAECGCGGPAAVDAAAVGAVPLPSHPECPEDWRMAVFAAGPTPLVAHVEELCAQLNGVWGRAGRAYLQVRALTHEM
ncbi:hypothetical protein Agub_g2609 [Astrephomene gubernaculifera]|uniref:FAD-binding FR-type domain-containing protein n=1 Tax=Astrephomene gubernaculifera TaxID=47775 RepID=A0AAD3DJZ6_9CHLO|nr:hypothetical protein Agub_g2609 [Astrephomene gubernaculifera]